MNKFEKWRGKAIRGPQAKLSSQSKAIEVMNDKILTVFFILSLQENFLIVNSNQENMERNSCLFWTVLNFSLLVSNTAFYILSKEVKDYNGNKMAQKMVIGGYLRISTNLIQFNDICFCFNRS